MFGIKERARLLVRHLRNNRLQEYERILKLALEHGYKVTSIRDSMDLLKDDDNKLLTLRHDVDHVSSATKMMFSLETKYGATATYYFRNSTFDIDLVREIEDYGSEGSLHYESIADYAKAWDIHTKKELEQTNYREPCIKLLKADLIRFRLLTGASCTTIASHGDARNRALQMPNNTLTEDVDTYADLGIQLEAYNQAYLAAYDIYISDTAIERNEGYRYGWSPFDAISMGKRRIMFLTHPSHWHYNRKKLLRKMAKSVLVPPIVSEEQFKRL